MSSSQLRLYIGNLTMLAAPSQVDLVSDNAKVHSPRIQKKKVMSRSRSHHCGNRKREVIENETRGYSSETETETEASSSCSLSSRVSSQPQETEPSSDGTILLSRWDAERKCNLTSSSSSSSSRSNCSPSYKRTKQGITSSSSLSPTITDDAPQQPKRSPSPTRGQSFNRRTLKTKMPPINNTNMSWRSKHHSFVKHQAATAEEETAIKIARYQYSLEPLILPLFNSRRPRRPRPRPVVNDVNCLMEEAMDIMSMTISHTRKGGSRRLSTTRS